MANKESNLPLVSIILPIYNVEKYLKKCLDSLLSQSLTQIEIIAINDGSTDSSPKILDQYAKQYPKIIKAFHKTNVGLSDARNIGIKKATGLYIGFVDSDDWVEPNMYEEMYNKAVETKSDIVVCAGMKCHVSLDGLKIERTQKMKIRANLNVCGYSIQEKPDLLFAVHSYAWNKIFKRHLFENENNLFPYGQWFEDSALIYNVLFQANKITCIPKYLYNYRVRREGAITNSISPKIFDIFKSCDSLKLYYDINIPKQKKIDTVLEKLTVGHIFTRFDTFFIKVKKDKLLSWKYANYSWKYLDKNFPGWKNRYKFTPNKRIPWKWYARKNKTLAFIYIFTPNWIKSIAFKGMHYTKMSKRKIQHIKKTKDIRAKKENIQENGFLVLNDLKKIFDELAIVYFVDFGTLLGFVRDGNFMQHDLDIDIGVICSEYQKLQISLAMKKAGHRIWRSYLNGNEILEQSYNYYDRKNKKILKFDINFYENSDNYSKTWLFYNNPQEQYKPMFRSIVEMKYSSIQGIKYIEIEGNTIPIPKNSEQLLVEKYGQTWKIPDYDWIYWKSPAATGLKEYGRFVQKHKQIEDGLPQIWTNQFYLLNKIKQTCSTNNLTYHIVKDSLLGITLPNNTYVSWNGDIDIFMTKDSYEIFISIFKDELLDNYIVLNHIADLSYSLPYVEILNLNNLNYADVSLFDSRIIIFIFKDTLPNYNGNCDVNKVRLLRGNQKIQIKEYNLLLASLYKKT